MRRILTALIVAAIATAPSVVALAHDGEDHSKDKHESKHQGGNVKGALTIMSPKPGAVVKPDFWITWTYKEGVGLDHLHISIDGQKPTSVDASKKKYEVTGLTPGQHKIKLMPATGTHKDMAASTRIIQVVVK